MKRKELIDIVDNESRIMLKNYNAQKFGLGEVGLSNLTVSNFEITAELLLDLQEIIADNLKNTYLIQDRITFRNCVFTDVQFKDISLDNIGDISLSFDGCLFSNVSFLDVNVIRWSFTDCSFSRVNSFANCSFKWCKFFNNASVKATFQGVLFTESSFCDMILGVTPYSYGICAFRNTFTRCLLTDLFVRKSVSVAENNTIDSSSFGFRITCPETGSFIGWKKLSDGHIAKLLIPEDAKRVSSSSRKCRCSKAIVLEIDGAEEGEAIASGYDPDFLYSVGKTVVPDCFDDNIEESCSNGIHFFMSREEAERY